MRGHTQLIQSTASETRSAPAACAAVRVLGFVCRWGCVWSVLYGLACCGAELPESDTRLLEGLRERRLYRLAAEYCEQQLAAEQDDELRARLTVELMRVRGEQALHAPADERAAEWQAAHEAAEHALRGGGGPYAVLIESQAALLRVAEGELAQQQAAVARGSQPDFTAALELLRQAEAALELVMRRIEQRDYEGGLTQEELFALRNHLRLELARLLIVRSRCYPRGSADQIGAASAALEVLQQLRSQLAADDPLTAHVLLEQLVCHRLLGSRAEVTRLLGQLQAERLPDELAQRGRAERIRAAVALEDWQQAAQWSDEPAVRRASGAAELDFARLEAAVALWQMHAAAQQTTEAAAARQRSLAMARDIESQHGSYWGRRADSLLVRSAQGSGQQADLEILRRRADDHYLRGDYALAVEAYDAAAEAADAAGQSDAAFLARYRAALVCAKQGDDAQAAIRLARLGREFPDHSDAAAVHFEAVKAAARAARQDPELLGSYAQLLEEHAGTWSSAPTAVTARLWLAQFHRFQRQFNKAIAQYAAIPASSPHAPAAVAGLAACWAEQLAAQPGGSPADVQQALDTLAGFATAAEAAPDVRATASISFARVVLQHAPHQAPRAVQLLDAVLQLDAAPSPAEAAQVRAWRLATRALAADTSLGDEVARQLAQLPPPQLVELAGLLAGLIAEQPAAPLAERLGRVQLALLRQLPAGQAEQQGRWRAAALAATGARQEALREYQTLIQQQPRSAALQVEYAALLGRSSQPADLRQALAQWRLVAQRSKPQSDTWYQAKYGAADTLLRLGDSSSRDQARELIGWLRAATPLHQTPWDARFRALEQQFSLLRP